MGNTMCCQGTDREQETNFDLQKDDTEYLKQQDENQKAISRNGLKELASKESGKSPQNAGLKPQTDPDRLNNYRDVGSLISQNNTTQQEQSQNTAQKHRFDAEGDAAGNGGQRELTEHNDSKEESELEFTQKTERKDPLFSDRGVQGGESDIIQLDQSSKKESRAEGSEYNQIPEVTSNEAITVHVANNEQKEEEVAQPRFQPEEEQPDQEDLIQLDQIEAQPPTEPAEQKNQEPEPNLQDELFKLIKEAHSQSLKLKTHSLSMSFNEPKEPGTQIDSHIYCSGEQFQHIADELLQWLIPSQQETKIENQIKFYVQMSIESMNTEAKVQKLNEIKSKLEQNPICQKYFSHIKMHFKEDDDGEYVVVGLDVSVPANDADVKQLNMEYLQLVKDTEQKVQLNVALGASMESMINEEVPFIKQMQKGFGVKAEIALIQNMKLVISQLLRSQNDDEKQLGKQLMPALAAFLLKINGKANLTFGEAEDLQDNPYLAPIFSTFNQIIEEITQNKEQSTLKKELQAKFSNQQNGQSEFITLLYDLFENFTETVAECPDHINVKCVIPVLQVASDIDIESQDLGKAGDLVLKYWLQPTVENALLDMETPNEESSN